jgi:hypothetical protein
MPFPKNPVYLVELFSLDEGGLESADVSGDLALALQTVYWHLKGSADPATVKVSDEPLGQLQGIAFLRSDETLLATITVYSLDQESAKAAEHVNAIHSIAKLTDARQMQAQLNMLF